MKVKLNGLYGSVEIDYCPVADSNKQDGGYNIDDILEKAQKQLALLPTPEDK